MANNHHVMVYTNYNEIVHCSAGYHEPGLLCESLVGEYSSNHGSNSCPGESCCFYVIRITETGAESANNPNANGNLQEFGQMGGSGGGIGDAISGVVNKIKALAKELIGENDEEFPKLTKKLSDEEYEKLYYKGLAKLDSKEEKDPYVSSLAKESWAFPSLSKLIDWATGIVTYTIRASITGFAQIVQLVTSYYVAEISGEKIDFNFDTELLTELDKQMKQSLTLEKIVYNQVPVLDVNVFGDTAGGKSVKDGSLTATIRELSAGWFYTFRTITIIALLLVLIYLGIKAAISTAVEDKATFKQLLLNWIVAFIIVITLPYIMIFVMRINESFIAIFSSIGKQMNLYETVRELTWSPKMTTGVIATVLYVCLVYYLLKFLVIYFKRLFVTVFLIIVSPLVVAKYAYDKVKGSRDNGAYGKWLKEYVFSVMMQTIHALVYTVFVSSVINLTGDTNYKLATIIIAFVFFNFMLRAEKILKDMLKLAGSSGTDFGDSESTSWKELFAWSFIMRNKDMISNRIDDAKSIASFAARPATNYISKKMKEPDSYIGKAGRLVAEIPNIGENAYTAIKKYDYEKLYGGSIADNDLQASRFVGKTLMDTEIDKAIREEYRMKMSMVKDMLGASAKVIGGLGTTFWGIPIMVTAQGSQGLLGGFGMITGGVYTALHAAGKPIVGYKKPEVKRTFKAKIERGTLKTMTAWATAGGSIIIGQMKDVYGDKLDALSNYSPKQLKALYQARNAELNIMKYAHDLKAREFKGFDDDATPMDKKLAEAYEEKLVKNIEEAQKTVSKKKIKDKIKEYEAQQKRFALNTTDLTKIAQKLNQKDPNNSANDIVIRNEITNNIKAQVMAGIISDVTMNNEGNVKIDASSMDEMIDTVRENLNTIKGESEEANKKREASELAIYLLEQKKEKNENARRGLDDFDSESEIHKENREPSKLSRYLDEQTKQKKENPRDGLEDMKDKFLNPENETSEKMNTSDILSNIKSGNKINVDVNKLPEDERANLNEALQQAISDETIDNAIGNATINELTDLMKRSINMEGSIEKEPVSDRFKDIVKEVEKIRDLNEQLMESKLGLNQDGDMQIGAGEPIFSTDELVGKIKSAIRNH